MRVKRMSVDDCGDGVGGVMEAVYEFEAEGDEESDSKEDVGCCGARAERREIAGNVPSDVDDGADGDGDEDESSDAAWALGEFFVYRGRDGRS